MKGGSPNGESESIPFLRCWGWIYLFIMNLEKINKDDLEQLFSLLNKMLGEEDNEKLGKKERNGHQKQAKNTGHFPS